MRNGLRLRTIVLTVFSFLSLVFVFQNCGKLSSLPSISEGGQGGPNPTPNEPGSGEPNPNPSPEPPDPGGGGTPTPTNPPSLKKYSFTVSNASMSNPERGWYSYAPLLGNDSFSNVANNGNRLVYSAITLKDFVNSDISASVLDKIKSRFAEMRSAGIKSVLRVNYNESDGGPTANFQQIEKHMQQLQSILEENKDVIAYIEGGYMGPWGEWHFWNVNNPPFPDNAASWDKLIALYTQYKPADRFVMIRYPSKKMEVFQGQNITEQNAFSSEKISRFGHHNDCFVSSIDDVGTYQPGQTQYASSVEELKDYLKKDTKYSPMGGETCATHERNNCSTTLQEMNDFSWTYMNSGYNTDVINKWKSEGCYDEIDRRLGYRFELKEIEFPEELEKGTSQRMIIKMKNSGFGRLWYQRVSYLQFIQNNQVIGTAAISNLNLRSWESGMEKSVEVSFVVPDDISGEVSVSLWMPDSNRQNHQEVRYSIQLANQGLWTIRGDNTIIPTVNIK